MKRVACTRNKRSTSTSLAFFAPELPCKVIYTLYVMSDSYLGLDQQYDIRLDVIPAPDTAVNGDIGDSQFMWQSSPCLIGFVQWKWLLIYIYATAHCAVMLGAVVKTLLLTDKFLGFHDITVMNIVSYSTCDQTLSSSLMHMCMMYGISCVVSTIHDVHNACINSLSSTTLVLAV